MLSQRLRLCSEHMIDELHQRERECGEERSTKSWGTVMDVSWLLLFDTLRFIMVLVFHEWVCAVVIVCLRLRSFTYTGPQDVNISSMVEKRTEWRTVALMFCRCWCESETEVSVSVVLSIYSDVMSLHRSAKLSWQVCVCVCVCVCVSSTDKLLVLNLTLFCQFPPNVVQKKQRWLLKPACFIPGN